MFAEWLRRHAAWAGIALGVIVGAVAGLFLPIRAATAPPRQAEAWALAPASASQRMAEADYQRLRSASLWGDVGNRARTTPKVQWRLLAIETRPHRRAAVQSGSERSPSWVPVGGRLPDGSILVAMDRDNVWSDADGCRRVRSLYSAGARTDPDACINRPADAAPPPASPAGGGACLLYTSPSPRD